MCGWLFWYELLYVCLLLVLAGVSYVWKDGKEEGRVPLSLKKRDRRIKVIEIERSRGCREESVARIDMGELVRMPLSNAKAIA